MPDFPTALLSFGKLTGVFESGGSMSWSWFGDPLNNTLASMAGPAQRPHVGAFFRALLDRTATADQDFDAAKKLVWEPLPIGPVNVGFVWNSEGQGLHIGFGAGATFPLAGESLTLGVLAGLIVVEAGGVEPEFGQVSLSGNFPVPPFITAVSLRLELPDFKVGIDVTAEIDGAPLTRTLAYDDGVTTGQILAWDALRVAAFVLEAWTDKQTGDIFRRIDDHLFPMLGSPPTINSLPPFDDDRMGLAPDFTGPNSWKNSVLTTAGNGAGALTMLWHTRALLTGNEDPNFLGGSFFFPITGAPSQGNPPTLANEGADYVRDPNATGAWIGIVDNVPNQYSLVLDVSAAGQLAPRIELARVTNGTLSRPAVPDVNAFFTAAPTITIGGEQIAATHVSGGWQVTLLNETLSGTGVPGFDGNYKLQLVLPDSAGGPVAFRADTPFLQVTLPPEENIAVAKDLLGSVAGIVIDALTPADVSNKLSDVLPALKTVVQTALDPAPPNLVALITPLLTALVEIAGSAVEFAVGANSPFSFTFPNGHIKPEIAIGPIKAGEENDPSFYIGKITAGAEIDLANGNLASATVGIVDFRIGTQAGAAGSLVGSLLPDMKEAEGFSLSVDVINGTVEGGGKIPIQKSLGPLEIAALLVDLRANSFSVGIDMSFELGPIRASVFELGIRFFFKDGDGHSAGDIEPFLNGLGVAMDTSAIKLAGMFLRHEDANGIVDYLGAATVAVVGYFELSAIGGYTQVDGESSLFIFASLVAPLGGTATIDLEIVSFEVDFGSDLEEPPPPPLDEFFTRQLAVPARPLNGGAKVATFNTVDAAGLVRVDFLYGKTEKEPKSQSNEQEGVAKPVSVDAEFAFAVRTRLPFDEPDGVDLDAAPGTAIAGKVNVPLCEKECLTSILKISGPGTAGAQRKRLLDLYPAATFGDTLQAVQPDQAQGAIGDVDSDKPSVPLTDTVEFYYIAKLKPASPPALTSKDTEESLDNEDYPLPLGWPHPQAQVHRVTKSKLLFSTSALTLDLGASKKVVNRRASALFARQDRKATPLHVSARTAGLQRFINPVQTDASTVAEPPKDAAIISVPGSPARRAELFGVNLRIVPPHSPVSLKRQRLETLSAAKNLERRALTPRDGARGTFNTSLNIEAGKAAWIDLTGGTPVRGTLAFAGQQTVRAIFLAATGEPLGDVYVAGARSLQAPPRTRRAVFIGEGLDAPLRAPAATAAAAEEEAAARVATAFPREAIGIEHDSVLLALGNGVFAGHGCILKANTSLGIAPQPLDSAPGSQVLRAATNVRVHFPALRKGWSLVLSVEPLVAEPGSAVREIRWRSLDAKLDGLHSVLTPDRTALLMSVEAAKPWSLEIDLGKKWRLAGIALVGREPRDIARTFKSKADWDLVDDRFRAAPPRTSTNITMQITQ